MERLESSDSSDEEEGNSARTEKRESKWSRLKRRVKKCCCSCWSDEKKKKKKTRRNKPERKRNQKDEGKSLLDPGDDQSSVSTSLSTRSSTISSYRKNQRLSPIKDDENKQYDTQDSDQRTSTDESQDSDQRSSTDESKLITIDPNTTMDNVDGSAEQSSTQKGTEGAKYDSQVPENIFKHHQQSEEWVDSDQSKKPKVDKEPTLIVIEKEDPMEEEEENELEKSVTPVPAKRFNANIEGNEAIYANLQHIGQEESRIAHQEAIYENTQNLHKKEHEDEIPRRHESSKTSVIGLKRHHERVDTVDLDQNKKTKVDEEATIMVIEKEDPVEKEKEVAISVTPVPTKKAPESNCLIEFLKSIGLDSEKYCKSLSTDGICTLKDLQQTINDEEKTKKFDSKLKGIDRKCLSEAVRHEDILKELQIIEHFPEGITLQKVMSKASGKLEVLTDVPWYFLSKMLMIDYRCRDDLLPKPECAESMDFEDSADDIFAQFTNERHQPSGPHPTDILIAIFQCSSNLLRQILCEKMFVCKLALPLLLPPFIYRKHMLLLWSLRNINIGYKTSKDEFCENPLVNCPTSIISCMRLGKPSISKSKFLNEILNGQTHNTFFHKDCTNGMLEREFTKGLLEFAVYIPSANKLNSRNRLSEVFTLVNLRGDGLENETSKDFLLKMSDIILAMVEVSDLDGDMIKSLKSITSSEKDLVLILTKKSSTQFDAECKQTIRNCVEEIKTERFNGNNLILGFTSSGEKNMKELLDSVLGKVSKVLEQKTKKSVIFGFKDLAISMHMKVDEETNECSNSHSVSQKLLEKVKGFNIENARVKLLPLQCQLWQEWARINKEKHRLLNKGRDTEDCDAKKRDIRLEQRDLFKKNKCFIGSFMELMNREENDRQYILKWLKLYLDDLSRDKIPVLQEEYGKKWEEICQTDEVTHVESLRNELNALEVRIADASFGTEHLFREMGQVYEAYVESSNHEVESNSPEINKLPRLMAELIRQGYPLEIMDGDASHVPLTWVKAVLRELAEVIGGDKKLFALSVLGAQSSGKSTLLNTMFGLQFPVAAGRCTRGVYAQLVPMCKDSNANYDYILVLDTEGLKAPELGKVKFNHDNEIATLVTGLGDVTLVNIKGENVSDMQDVLQIVVHAILKMRLVNKSLKMQPTCIFLHQNVSVPDAAQKMKKGQQNFMEILNKVTRTTGEMENAPHISKLHQVIEFDIDKHIWYFSDLWEGDPPMAPANPGYSDKVQKLKKNLLTDVMQQRTHCLTISDLILKIEDLWNGILHEDFVFSLKNNLESRAYIALETKLLDITENLKRCSYEWINKNRHIIFNSGGNKQNLKDEFERHLEEEFRNSKRKLETYFEMSDDKEMIEQWMENMMSKLAEAKSNLKKEVTKLLPLETSL